MWLSAAGAQYVLSLGGSIAYYIRLECSGYGVTGYVITWAIFSEILTRVKAQKHSSWYYLEKKMTMLYTLNSQKTFHSSPHVFCEFKVCNMVIYFCNILKSYGMCFVTPKFAIFQSFKRYSWHNRFRIAHLLQELDMWCLYEFRV